MRIHAVQWSVFGVLSLGLCLLVGKKEVLQRPGISRTKAAAAAKAAVLEFVEGKGDPKEIANQHEQEDVMAAFKLREKGGIGVGVKPGSIKPDGIDAKLYATANKKLPDAILEAEAPDLIKMVEIIQVIGEINAHYPVLGAEGQALVKKYNDDMIQASKKLKEMIKGDDPAKVKTAATKLVATCIKCHRLYSTDAQDAVIRPNSHAAVIRLDAPGAVIRLAEGKGNPRGIAAKHELGEEVMRSFKLRTKGGIGVGKVGTIKPDGIESKIQALAKTKLREDELKAQAPDLIQMLDVTRAIGEIATFYPDPAKKNPELWKQYNENMIKVSKNLQDMINGGDPAKVKTGANKLSATCNNCHKEFRDDS